MHPLNQADRIHGHGYAGMQLATEAAVHKETKKELVT